MDSQERKLKQRIERRKEKVQRMIKEQESRLDALDEASFLHHEDYLEARSAALKKLDRLKKELSGLESGYLSWP